MGMTFTIKIDTENAAFSPAGPEVARILREIAHDVEAQGILMFDRYQTLRDINGNDVGRAGWKRTATP